MKAEIKKQQFITMRIEGKSFEEIAKALSIPKTNLVEWNKENKEAIKEGLAIQLNDTARGLQMGKQNRIAATLRIYKKVVEEIERRDLSDVDTGKLIQLAAMLSKQIEEQSTMVEIGQNEAEIVWGGQYFNLNTLE